jgi:hypothetical protein
MNSRRIRSFLLVLVLLTLTSQLVFAEDGIIFHRDISKTPGAETEKAGIFMMDFYVPAQAADGTVGPVDNYILDDDLGTAGYEPRDFAKPLVSVYIDEIGALLEEEEVEAMGGIALGEFDAFVGVSLDDGTTWKTTNLSKSSDLSSFTLENGHEYLGGVHALVHQVFGDRILVAWAGKYCDGGTPSYTLDPLEDADYLTDLETTYGKDAVYLYDLFGVAGSQGSVDYTLQGYPEVGEIPYSCIWVARGKLLPGDDPATTDVAEASYVMWAKPERLTSAARDANLPAVDCAASGCVLTWQEDPEGLRPGQGLGPGEGWSGAIANSKTDMWYSYISAADFDLVFADATLTAGTAVTMGAYTTDTMPKAYVPMAIPMRLTDNNMCKSTKSDPYCYIDFDTIDDIDHTNVQTLLDLAGPESDADYCAEIVPWTTPNGNILQICKTDDGRVLNGRIASTRTRWNLKPYTKADGTKSAWVVMAYEETKALGDICTDGLIDDGDTSDKCDPIDIGKDVWYHSFDMFEPDMVAQGGMLNQPAVCKDALDPYCTGGVGEFYDVQTDLLNGGEYYLTEIARRFALTTNSVSAAATSESGLSAMLIYKQGIINQGGPADIMLRRMVIPDDFDATIDNPYAYENMDCTEWVYTDGTNPNYLNGVCLSPAINITGNTIERCDGGADNDTCAALFPMNDDGSNTSDGSFPKVYEWRQCDGTSAIEGCEDDNDLDDQPWENPYDVAKGHRGYLDGDIVMMMYAWAPNWNSNTVGNDHYNLYIRRSFDGGVTWTTTPASLGGAGVTVTEYYYGESIGDPVPVEWTYEAGAFEQGRNVSLLTGNKVTILDPRYSPTGGMKLYPTIKTDWLTANNISFEGLPYTDDVRVRDKFFIVYETGDNTTVAVGEATPLDLFYSRGTEYGDVWEVMDYPTTTDDLLVDRWPWLENKEDDLSGEAGMVANPGGTFCYVVWNQWKEEILPDGEELIYDADMPFRRLMYLPDDTEIELAPVASILYTSATMVSQSADDILTLTGTARDLDVVGDGIVAYKWTSNLDGEVGNDQVLQIPAADLSRGRHTFTFTALDAEGHWSTGKSVTVVVAETVYRVALPMVMNNK